MKLTTRGRYAVTAMMDLALHAKLDRVTLADIAERQQISLSYLEQLFTKLRKAGLVNSVRGPAGGFSLARSDKTISLADILLAVDENIDLSCAGDACSSETPCLTHGLWTQLSAQFHAFFESKKLGDLIRERDVQTLATAQDITCVGNIPVQIDRDPR